jgi:hypothetical protein
LNYDNIKQYLIEGAQLTKEEWETDCHKTDEDVIKMIKEYLPFAWEKANGCRGLSAGRSIEHFRAWTWLIGRDEEVDWKSYNWYGKNLLVKISEMFGVDWSKLDDNEWVNSEDDEPIDSLTALGVKDEE